MKKTKYGDWEKIITFPIYSEFQVHMIFTEDVDDSYLNRYGVPRNGTVGCDALVKTAVGGHCHMFFTHGVSVGTMAHEAWHVVYSMFNYVGADIDDNENAAYHLGYIVDAVYEFERLVDFARGAREGWVKVKQSSDVKSHTKKVNDEDDQSKVTRRTPVGLQDVLGTQTEETQEVRTGDEAGSSGTNSRSGCPSGGRRRSR